MRDESSFTRRVSEALSAVEMNTVSMREARNFQELSEQELLCKKSVTVEPCR